MQVLERCRTVEKRFPMAPSGGPVNQKDGWTRHKQYSTPDNVLEFWSVEGDQIRGQLQEGQPHSKDFDL